MQEYLDHLHVVTLERSLYTKQLQQCKESVKKHYSVDGILTAPPLNCCVPPNSVDIEAHYSFDFAQQVL